MIPIKENLETIIQRLLNMKINSISYRTNEERYIDKNYIDKNGDGYNFAKLVLELFENLLLEINLVLDMDKKVLLVI